MKQIIIEPQALSFKLQAKLKIGEFIHVKITRAIPFKLYGEIIDF
jgi:hypothetical protein